METKRELFNHLAKNKGLYLPMVQLTRAFEELKEAKQRMKKLAEIEKDERYQHYTNPAKGAYSDGSKQEAMLAKVRKAVIQIDPISGKKLKEFESLYYIRHNTDFDEGNISRAIKTGGLAGGYRWEFKED